MSETKRIVEQKGTDRLKRGFAKMVKGGVVMDVTNAEQAKIAEAAGAFPLWHSKLFLQTYAQEAA